MLIQRTDSIFLIIQVKFMLAWNIDIIKEIKIFNGIWL